MNHQTLNDLLLAVSREPPVVDVRDNLLLAGFASEDEILAAFLDGTLTPEQQVNVKRALAANARLRQQWQACKDALEAGNVQRSSRWRYTSGLALAASVVLALLVTLQWPMPQPPEHPVVNVGSSGAMAKQWSNDGVSLDLPMTIPTVEHASTTASQAVPVGAWEMYLGVYLNWTESPGGTYMPFAMTAAALSRLEEVCREELRDDSNWLSEYRSSFADAQQTFSEIQARYPQALTPFLPTSESEWCDLGSRLQQYAARAVSSQDDFNNHSMEDEP